MPGPGVFCFPTALCLPPPHSLSLHSPPTVSFLSPSVSPRLLCHSPCFPPSYLLCISSSLSPSPVCLILFNLYFPWKQTPFSWDPAPHELSPGHERRSVPAYTLPGPWPLEASHPHVRHTHVPAAQAAGVQAVQHQPGLAMAQLPPQHPSQQL